MLLWTLPVALAATFLAPAVTLIQNIAPVAQRSVFGAIYLLANNLVGLGAGPLYVGMVSDRLEPAHGNWALGLGLLAVIPVFAVGSLGQFLVARKLRQQGVATLKTRSEEHTSELQSLMRISYAVFCL